MLIRFRILNDFQWSRDLLDFFDRAESRANASVQTQDGVFHDCGEWHVLKDFVESLEDGIRIVDVFSEFDRTFVCEAHCFVQASVFHVTAEQVDLIEILEFQCKE